MKNPEKYHFDPRSLLEKLVHIFINLGGRRAFATAVANDGRSYSHTMFMRALDIMRKQHGLRPPFPMVLLPLPITSYLSMPSRSFHSSMIVVDNYILLTIHIISIASRSLLSPYSPSALFYSQLITNNVIGSNFRV